MAGRMLARSIVRSLVIKPCARSSCSFGSYSALNNVRSHASRFAAESILPFTVGICSSLLYSTEASHLPQITDPDVLGPFKDLMAASWHELPDAVVTNAKNALSKSSRDKKGQEVLANVFHAAEAVEHFGGTLVTLKMDLDDRSGLSGEIVNPLPKDVQDALRAAYKRYETYINAFGPDEAYLKKKVEMELGSKMIHIKMRCSNLDPEWGKITVLGTSGLSGSYIEHRA